MENKEQSIDGDQCPAIPSVSTSTGESETVNPLSSHYKSTGIEDTQSLEFPAPVVTKQQGAGTDGTKENISGLARFEGVRSCTEKAKAETTMDNQAKLYKYNSVVRDSSILLDGEALSTRLTIKEGTNRKRARSVDLSAFNELHQLSHNTANHKEPKIHRTARSCSERIEIEECAQGRNLPAADQSCVEHDAEDMSQGSSGNNRHTHNSSRSADILLVDPLGGANTTVTLEDEIPDSADQIPIFVSCQRVTRDTQQEFAEEGSNAAESLEHLREGIDASAANAHNQNAATDSNDTPQKKKKKLKSSWAFGRARYSDPRKGSQPDYGPTAPYPPVIGQEEEEMPIPGGHKPVNRLGATNPTPLFKYQNPALSGPKVFEIKASAKNSRREEESRPAKKPRVEDPYSLRNGTSAAPIELLDEPPQNLYRRPSYSRPPSSTKSGNSYGRSGLERNPSFRGDTVVSEYRRVENTMKHKTRNRSSSSDGASTKLGGSQRFLPTAQLAKERTEVDLSDDIIASETEDELSHTVSSKKAHVTPMKKKVLQVEIPARPQIGKTTRYQGTANRMPPRLRENGNLVKPATQHKETGESSPHFNKGQSRGSHISMPRSTEDQATTNSSRTTRQAKGKESDDSGVDELAPGQFEIEELEQIQIAKDLLASHNQSKRSSNSSKGKGDRPASNEVDVSSDEDAQIQTSDIKPTNFGLDRPESKKRPGEEAYQVSQLFSETHQWLLKDSNQSFVLRHHKKDNLLTFYDQEKIVVRFPTKEVEKIEICETDSKMVIHKSRTQTALGATKIYIEFGNVDLCQQLLEALKDRDPTIGKITKDADHLDKVFRNVPSKPKPHKRRRPSAEEEPDDIRLAKANSERANGQRWDAIQSSARTNTGTASQRDGNLDRDTQRSQGIAKEMRDRSTSSGPFEVDGTSQHLGATGLHPDTFYQSSGTGLRGALSRGTRSSARVPESRNRSHVLRQSVRQRSRSPSPVRWTANNPGWEKSWQSSVIYPREGKDKVCVDKQDIERLDEGEFLNDNLIIFYLRWLEHRLGQRSPDLARRIYIHNTFFYTRLTKDGKGKTGGINYEAVERWTSKVDLLSYDYIVVPVNETVHWYVAIIINAPKLLEKAVEEAKGSQSETIEDADDKQMPILTDHKSITASAMQSLDTELPIVANAEMEVMSLDEKPNLLSSDGLEHAYADASSKASLRHNEKDMMDLDNPPPMNVKSDLLPDLPESKLAKKGKRKSTPALRKYDPNEPRIITLDSLGISHSPTCTNLKKYLMQEIKAKKNIEIADPGSLGMTAKNIPGQNNYCDCGLFLLGYIDEFLKRPDEFVREILQRETPQAHTTNDDDSTDKKPEWVNASEMRNEIRNTLLDLQKKQQVKETDEALRKEKGKGKRAAKTDGSTASTSLSTLTSREASKSARASPSLEKDQTPPESTDQPRLETTRRHQESARLDSSGIAKVENPPKSGRARLSDAVGARNDEVRDNSKKTPGTLERLTNFVMESTTKFCRKIGLEENGDSAPQSPDLGPHQSEYITIDDSQEMDGTEPHIPGLSTHVRQDHEHVPQKPTSRDMPNNSNSSRIRKPAEIPEVPGKSKKPQILHHPLPYSSPPSRSRGLDSTLQSPSPEQEHDRRSDSRREFKDKLHTKDLESPSKDYQQKHHDHRNGFHPGDGNVAQVGDNDEVRMIDPSPRLKPWMTRNLEDSQVDDADAFDQHEDGDMLLAHEDPRELHSSASFLSTSSKLSSPPSAPARKRREGRNSISSSPTSIREELRNGAQTDPPTTRKRKAVTELENSHRFSRTPHRDPSDLAVIGKHRGF